MLYEYEKIERGTPCLSYIVLYWVILGMLRHVFSDHSETTWSIGMGTIQLKVPCYQLYRLKVSIYRLFIVRFVMIR